MKQIINGKKYDTDTAEIISTRNNGYGMSDFKWLDETLYRKKTGEFFLSGEGGPMTQYREPVGNGWTYGEKIIPLTIEEAREWGENHMSCDEYESIFGPVSE